MRGTGVFVASVAILSSVATTNSSSAISSTDAVTGKPHPGVHSSDGVPGPRLSTVRTGSELLRSAVAADSEAWQVAPGLSYSRTTLLEPQGAVQVHVLTAAWNQRGLGLDQVSGSTVASRSSLSGLLATDHDVAGVNADFFDITDTGAPLGVGVDRERRLLHATRSGWNNTFFIDSTGVPRIGQVSLAARVVRNGTTAVRLRGFNLPHVARDSINVYTEAWGRTAGSQVVDGASQVRQVQIRNHVVRSNRAEVTSGAVIRGKILVGRGLGAIALRGLKVGQRVSVVAGLSSPSIRVAVSGSAQLVRNGQVITVDNGELHPRTAVGIDRDKHLLHLLVADGRSESSSGLTLLQLGDYMDSLGDEDVLNLDGGGSSTMVAPDANGVSGVRNTPSDGHERLIANGLGVRYTALG